MGFAERDQNRVTTLLAVSKTDGVTPVALWADPVTHRLLVDNANSGITLTTTGTSGAATLVGNTLNIPVYGGVTSVTSANADIAVANSTTTPVLTLNSSIASAASTIVKRDANGNVFFNNYFGNLTSTASAGTTTILTVSSSRYQTLTGTLNQTYQLPDATTLALSQVFTFNNNSSGSLIITNNGATTQYTIPAGGYVECFVTDISTANGVWDFHPLPPKTATWGSGVTGLVMNTVLTTTPAISAGASGSTSPAFIPQRGSLTTGFGGDSSNLYGVIGGTAAFTSSATNFTAPAFNGLTITASTGTLTVANGKTATINNTLTLAGTDSTTMTFPSTSATIARTDAAQTFTGTQTFANTVLTANAITATANAATIPVTSGRNIVTNNSAAGLTITLTTASAVNMQTVIVQILDFSAVAQTLTLVNTENSTITPPTTTNGSTTLPLTLGFIFNSATTKWRLIASA